MHRSILAVLVLLCALPLAAEEPLIPRAVLFGNPDRTSVSLSHDGERIAFLAAVDGVLNVWVGPSDNPDAAEPVTSDTGRGIRTYFWAFNNSHIVYAQDKGGDENWRIYSVEVETRAENDLTPFEGVQARVQHVSPNFPDELLIGLNDRNPQLHDIHRINIRTGERQLVLENPGILGGGQVVNYTTDDDFAVRFAFAMLPDGSAKYLTAGADGAWADFLAIPAEDLLTSGIIGLDKSGQNIYMTDSRQRNTGALFTQAIQSGERQLLAEDERADIGGLIVHPTAKHVQAAAVEYDRRRWIVLDESIQADLDHLAAVDDGDMNINSRTQADDKWVVSYNRDDGPVRYYLYDRPAQQATFLFTNRKELEGKTLAKMHPVVIESRDELALVSYLTLPPGSDPDGDGRPTEAQSLVLLVHGGPWGRDAWGYDGIHQWLANRGYAVLSVNFRGSTGFGKNFTNAGDMEWGAKMHDDLIDAVEWAVAEGITHQDQVAIMGGSYGGYATLAGLTMTPEVFACGVDIVGPSNLVTLLESIPPYWKPMLDLFATRVGDPRTEEGRALLTERSPLTYADRIVKPLLIGQGANDPRVKQAESDQIVSAMQAKNIPVTYTLFPDEGHGFARPENRLAFFAVTEAFLAQYLGGRHEPIGDAFSGSSIEVPEGAALIPDLAANLMQ